MRKIRRKGGRFLAAALCCGAIASGVTQARPISLAERVEAQRAIERVFWSHRIWPEQNASPKPPLAAVISDAAIRSRVEDDLRKSRALEAIWRRPVTGEQLQAELDRMGSQTRDGAMLAELFHALGDDPALIADTLARKTLVDRLIRSWYAADRRFHGELAARAAAALASASDVSGMRSMGGVYQEVVRVLETDGCPPIPVGSSELRLDATAWGAHLERLARTLQTTADALPIKRLSQLEETSDAFLVTAVLERSATRTVVATVTWPKVSYDVWWGARRGRLEPVVESSSGRFSLPSIAPLACAPDQWTQIASAAPDGREAHTAIWTGTEMIVWGGSGPSPLNTGGRYTPATDSWLPTSASTNVPTARVACTAIWTGTEMIVWGGFNGSYKNTGGRYAPATDTWIPTSTGPGVPSPRSSHTAVWTGTEMIVWGGHAPMRVGLATGGRYAPASDTWAATSTGANTPVARDSHTAVWSGTEMIVWGGHDTSTATLSSGARYKPSSDSWVPTSGTNAPAARDAHTVVWTGTEMIVWGGNRNGPYFNTGGRYSPSTDSWIPTSIGANVPSGRFAHNAVWTGSEMFVWGGFDGAYQNTGGRYSPSGDTWTATSTGGAASIPRYFPTSIWTGTEVILWGGYSGAFENTGARYTPSSDSWIPTSTGANVPGARYGHTAVWTGSEMIVWGGNDGGRVNTGGRYAPSLDTWTPTSTGANTPSPRSQYTAIWTGTEMIVWGGYDGAYVNTGGRYAPSTDTWIATSLGAGVPDGRYYHTAVWTGTEMIVWGGLTTVFSNTGGRYDPAADTWVATATTSNVPSGRYFHSAIWDGAEMIVWGGYDGNGDVNTGGRYSPPTDSWAATSSVGAPDPRISHTAIWTGTEMIVWGGANSSRLSSGGRYEPSTDTWTPTSTGGAVPSARDDHTATWTGTDMVVWGGLDGGGTALDTGASYSPSTDTWAPTATGTFVPAARYSHTAAWTGRQLIVWGGSNGSPMAAGAAYCACPNGSILSGLYRDADGDGYGAGPAISLPSCDGSIPAGYSTSSGDCDDTLAAVHPNATETCNGRDDDCNGFVDDGARPAAVDDGLRIANGGIISWNAAPCSTASSVLRGLIGALPVGPGAGDEVCLAASSAGTFLSDPDVPSPGSGFWYLVRGESAAGSGPYGDQLVNAVPAPRDSATCPSSR